MLPYSQNNQNINNQSNDVIADFKNWWAKVPLFTKFFAYFTTALFFLSIVNPYLVDIFSNKIYFTIFHYEVFRIIFCLFITSGIGEFAFSLFIFIPLGIEKEKQNGTFQFIFDFFFKNFLIQIIFIMILFPLGYYNTVFWEQMSYGIFPYFMMNLTCKCVKNSEEPTMFLCLPFQIKSKFYPLFLSLVIFLFFGFNLDIIIGLLIGLLEYHFLEKKLKLNRQFLANLELNQYLSLMKYSANFVAIDETQEINEQQSSTFNTRLIVNTNNNRDIQPQKKSFSGQGQIIGENSVEEQKTSHNDPEMLFDDSTTNTPKTSSHEEFNKQEYQNLSNNLL